MTALLLFTLLFGVHDQCEVCWEPSETADYYEVHIGFIYNHRKYGPWLAGTTTETCFDVTWGDPHNAVLYVQASACNAAGCSSLDDR